MVFVFDENIPGKIVDTLSALYKDCGNAHELHSVYTLGLQGAKDVELMPAIRARFPNEQCVFISGDARILRRALEIESVKQAEFIGFICSPKSCQKSFLERALYIMNLWPAIIRIAEKSVPKTIYKMPAISFVPTEKEFKKL